MAALPLSAMLGSPNTQTLQIQSATQVRIQQKNFIVVKTNLVGQSKGFSLLGFITIIPARVTTAMNRLYSSAHMQEGQSQSLANMMLEENSSYFILFGVPRTTIRGDLVEFTAPAPPAPLPPEH
ncbi:MAG TPA: DUF6567 family protein [Verrucomicrobiae bacterium]